MSDATPLPQRLRSLLRPTGLPKGVTERSREHHQDGARGPGARAVLPDPAQSQSPPGSEALFWGQGQQLGPLHGPSALALTPQPPGTRCGRDPLAASWPEWEPGLFQTDRKRP